MRSAPATRIVILSMHDSDSYVLEAVRCGATGFIAKGAASSELVRAVRAASVGRRYLRPAVPDATIEQYLHRARAGSSDVYDLLTRREREVLHLVAEGLSSAAIAKRLGISPRTAEAHRASVMRRLGLKGRTELIRYALSRGLVPLDMASRPRGKEDDEPELRPLTPRLPAARLLLTHALPWRLLRPPGAVAASGPFRESACWSSTTAPTSVT